MLISPPSILPFPSPMTDADNSDPSRLHHRTFCMINIHTTPCSSFSIFSLYDCVLRLFAQAKFSRQTLYTIELHTTPCDEQFSFFSLYTAACSSSSSLLQQRCSRQTIYTTKFDTQSSTDLYAYGVLCNFKVCGSPIPSLLCNALQHDAD